MKKALIIATAAAIISSANSAQSADAPPKEKCYGIAKAGKNDCGWAGGSCAGTAKKDSEAGAWLLLPKGVCAKLAGGTTEEPKK